MPHEDETQGAAFPHDSDYRSLNQGPHPIIPPRLSAPALNWHIAAWNPRDGTSARAWHKQLAEIVVGMLNRCNELETDAQGYSAPTYKALSLNDTKLSAETVLTLFNHQIKMEESKWKCGDYTLLPNPFRFETASAAVLWGGQLVKINVQVHSEYTTFTFWLPAFRQAFDEERMRLGSAAVLCEGRKADLIRRHFAQIWCYIASQAFPENRHAVLSALNIESKDIGTEEELLRKITNSKPQRELFETILIELSDDLFPEMRSQAIGDGRKELIRAFADFRSLVLPSEMPFCSRDGSGWRPSTRGYSRETAALLMNRLSNFFSRESASRAEVCGSLFLGGRVAYVTSMGSQAGDAGGVRIARHMAIGRSNRFVMIAQPMTRWQLGRLVERLNILGTYRLAALRDLPRLNEVSRKVRRIGNVLDRYRRREKLLALDPDKAARDLKRWSWALSKLRVHFAALSGPAAGGVATPGDGMTGGIAYRIERSRYYVARFHSTLSDLRIRRVEGFQPYDEFVRRRYAGTWDRIDRLGERYQRLQQRLNESGNELELLEQSRQTISIMQSTKAQERQTASIANSTQAQLRQTKAQVELLRAAERFAIFPVSYYGGMLFSDFFHVLHLNPGDHGIIPGLIIATMYAIYQSLNINLELKREAQGAQPQKLPVDASHERSRNRELWLWVVVAAALASSAYLLHLRLPAEKTVKSPPPLHVTPSPQKPLPTQIKNKAELARPLVNRPEQKHLK